MLLKLAAGKRYTINVKDTLLPNDPITGREQATISYEYGFQLIGDLYPNGTEKVEIPWTAFEATYRGRKNDTAPPLKTAEIKRFGIMMRR
jgi:hypothetical protein